MIVEIKDFNRYTDLASGIDLDSLQIPSTPSQFQTVYLYLMDESTLVVATVRLLSNEGLYRHTAKQ